MANKIMTVEVPTVAIAERIEKAICGTFSYQPQIRDLSWVFDEEKPSIVEAPMIANPQNKADFVLECISTHFLKKTLQAFEVNLSKQTMVNDKAKEIKDLW